jgi:hypothetical protein
MHLSSPLSLAISQRGSGFPFSGASLDLDFANGRYYQQGVGSAPSSILSCTRASVGYAADLSGNYGPFANNVLRITNAGLTLENTSTNLCLHSTDLTNAVWTAASATPLAAQITAPDGTLTGNLWTSGSTGYPSVFQAITAVNATVYTGSVFAKAGNSTSLTIELRGSSGATTDYTFTLSGAGTATINGSAVGSPTGTIKYVGNGWYLCTVTKTTTNTTPKFIIGQNPSTVGNTVYLWNAQYEASSFATSPIPTTGSSATRASDSVLFTSFPAISGAMTAFVAATCLAPTATAAGIFNSDDGTSNNNFNMLSNSSGTVRFQSKQGGTLNVNAGSASFTQGALTKMAFAGQTGDYVGYIGGSLQGTASSGTFPTLTEGGLAASAASGANMNMLVSRVAIFPTRLPNATLAARTT